MAGLLTGSQQRRDCQSTTMLKGFKVKKQIQKKKILDIIFILLILTNTNNSFVKVNDNNISGLLDCFISGDGNNIYGGSFVSLNSISNIIFSSNTINNNYMSIVGSNNIIIENQAASSNPINNFFTILNNFM